MPKRIPTWFSSGVSPGGDPGNYKIPGPQRLGASDFHFAPNRPAFFPELCFPFRNSKENVALPMDSPWGGPAPQGKYILFPRGETLGDVNPRISSGFSPGGIPGFSPGGKVGGIALRRVFPRGNSRGFPRGFPLGSLKCHCALPRVFHGVFLGVFHRGGRYPGFSSGFSSGGKPWVKVFPLENAYPGFSSGFSLGVLALLSKSS